MTRFYQRTIIPDPGEWAIINCHGEVDATSSSLETALSDHQALTKGFPEDAPYTIQEPEETPIGQKDHPPL